MVRWRAVCCVLPPFRPSFFLTDGEMSFEEFQSWWTRYEQRMDSAASSLTNKRNWQKAGRSAGIKGLMPALQETNGEWLGQQEGGGVDGLSGSAKAADGKVCPTQRHS
jgi:hypothetical protein